ncbi:polysaccharide deacetylase family protein, partial [Pseudarthrobacter sp. PvP022]
MKLLDHRPYQRRRDPGPENKWLTRWTAAASVVAVAASVLAGAFFAAPAHAADPPVITLTFDDANADQVAAAQILNQAGLKGTFYAPSGYLDATEYMTTAQALALQTAGNEIGGHTVTHPDLALAGADEVKRQICNDRVNLTTKGFRVTSFAYPFASISAAAKQAVIDCGFNSARSLGDLESHVVGTAGFGFAEAIPPADPFETRAPDQVDNSWTLQNLKDVVLKAQPAGGWVQLTFHHIGTSTDPLTVSTAIYSDFVTFLKDEQAAGRITVKTVDQVIGGALKPAVSGPTAPPAQTSGNLIHNPGLETPGPVAGGLPQCWAPGGWGTNTRTFSTSTPGHTGTVAGRLDITAWTDGDGKILPSLDLGECAPSAIPGHQYQVKAWYQSTGNTQFELYYRTGLGTWSYWQGAGSPYFAPANVWTQATYLTPPVPAGATAISMGMNLLGTGTLLTDDFELLDVAATAPAEAVTAIAAAATAPPGLGQPLGVITCGLAAGGCYQNYPGGVIHWSAATGARITKGAIDAAWAAQGWENGGLGYPTSNEIGGLKDGGVYQNFQGGVIHWSPATGARITKGAIDAAWAAQGWENGGLGYPTSNEIGG